MVSTKLFSPPMKQRFTSPPLVKGIDFSEGEIFESLIHNKMLMLTLFTSKVCNLACPYCFTSSWGKEKKLLSLDEYKDLIIQAKELGIKSIWWAGTGEPFLYEYWREIIDFVTSEKLWVGIFTNGTLITQQEAEFLVEKNVSLYVKMNSFNPSIQNYLNGHIDGSFEKIQHAIEALLNVGFNCANRFAIETVITRLNYDEIPLIYRWAREQNIIPFIEMMEYANIDVGELDVPIEMHRTLFHKLSEIDKAEFGYEWQPFPPWVGMRCRNVYLGIAVNADGYMQPCSGLKIPFGNVLEKSLKSLWNSNEAKKFRDPKNNEPENCIHGTLGNYGCKSHAFHITKNPFAIDPRIAAF